MKNVFKIPIEKLLLDLEDYDYLLGDLNVDDFGNYNSSQYINDINFQKCFPVTHKFILLEHIIYYIGFIEGSYSINLPINEWGKQSFDKEIKNYLENNENRNNIFYYILKGYREAFYEKELYGVENPESKELINAGNGLIPIMKFLHYNSNEFK